MMNHFSHKGINKMHVQQRWETTAHRLQLQVVDASTVVAWSNTIGGGERDLPAPGAEK